MIILLYGILKIYFQNLYIKNKVEFRILQLKKKICLFASEYGIVRGIKIKNNYESYLIKK